MKQSKTFSSGFSVEETIETLRQQLSEVLEVKAAENASWNAAYNIQAEQIESLRKQLAEKDAEIEQLKEDGNMPVKYYQPNGKGPVYAVYGASSIDFADSLLEQLAASQAREVQLREALKTAGMNCVDDFIAAGALQLADSKSDTSALEAMIAEAGEVMRERMASSGFSQPHEEYFGDVIQLTIRALPGVTLEDVK